MTSVLLQCTPRMVLTTPMLQGRLRRLTVVMWLALSGGFAAVVALLLGHFVWFFIATGLVLLMFVALMLSPWLWIAVLLTSSTINLFSPGWLLHSLTGEDIPLLTVGGGVLLLGLGCYQLAYLFPQHGRRVRQRAGMSFWSRSGLDNLGLLTSWKRQSTASFLFRIALRRDCTGRKPGPLLMDALGPRFYAYQWLWPTACVLAAVLHLLVRWRIMMAAPPAFPSGRC